MKTFLILFAILVGLVVYGNVGWAYLYFVWKVDNQFSKCLRGGDPRCYKAQMNLSEVRLYFLCAIFWPLTLIILLVYWFCWFTLGGIGKMITGQRLE